jgi:hypothetical protein
MMTRKEQFKEELRALLGRFNAEIELVSLRDKHDLSAGEQMEVHLDAQYVGDELVEDQERFTIGTWISGTAV